MTTDDLKEQLLVTWNRIAERVQETPVYNQLKERFDGLSPSMQKIVVVIGGVLAWFLIISVPWSWYSDSSTLVEGFEERRSVIRELLKVSREAADVPPLMPSPPIESLRSDVESRLRGANLTPEQIKAIDLGGGGSQLIPNERSLGSLSISLWKLNIRQVVDVGTQLSRLNPSVKLTGTDIAANREDNHYFDVVFKLTALAVPDLSAPVAAPEEPARGGRANRARSAEETNE
ncbi:MAG: hypothetical protein KF802_15405 [Bdellovibrionaceae bacterium]|nr:hypothetical protein [Pseudobdellovibrionaceae bacterium]